MKTYQVQHKTPSGWYWYRVTDPLFKSLAKARLHVLSAIASADWAGGSVRANWRIVDQTDPRFIS